MSEMDQPSDGFSSQDESMQGDDNIYQSFEVPTKQGDGSFEATDSHIPTKQVAPAPLKSCLKRRNSTGAESLIDEADLLSEEQPAPTVNGAPKAERKSPQIVDPFALSVTARLCGPSRSKCGYCGGKRIQVLKVDDGHNKVLSVIEHGEVKTPLWSNVPDFDTVDEENTSKSYGLLFDYLPYDTYQELIDRGWRRSGKHLYRPHNFESCCPAISIRLDTTKFAPNSSKGGQNEMERRVLVGGSKSQRRVGRNLLRALEAYNVKHSGCTETKRDTDEQLRVAKINLSPESIEGSEANGFASTKIDAGVATDSAHKNKRSRRASPGREDLISPPSAHADGVFGELIDKNVLVSIEEAEHELLQQLAQLTYQTINDVATKIVNAKSRPKWAWWGPAQTNEIPKWCLFKCVAANRALVKDVDCTTSGAYIMASTVACAAASGRSRGLIDRAELSAAVVKSLKEHLSQSQNKPSKLEFCNVACHEKSGQVQIILRLPSQYLTELSISAQASKESEENVKGKTPAAPQDPLDEPFTEYLTRFSDEMKLTKDLKDASIPQSELSKHRQLHLVVKTVPVYESSLQPEVHRLFCAYQTATHGDVNPFLSNGTNNGYGSDGEYNFHLENKSVGFMDVDATYSHLSTNQRSKIKKSYLSFYRFLCETPLKHESLGPACTSEHDAEANLEDGYDTNITRGGTYHQQYRLCTSQDSFDGPLIAVGVVDILPKCLSSVYAFYDPKLSAKIELGKYTALREIEWVQRAKWITNRYYYLGYYIHSCQKMIYKAEYKPSELLCPVNFKWVDFEVAKRRLQQKSPTRHCCALYEDDASDGCGESRPYIENVVLEIGDGGFRGGTPSLLTVSMLTRDGRRMIDSVITEYVNEVGTEIARKLIVKLS